MFEHGMCCRGESRLDALQGVTEWRDHHRRRHEFDGDQRRRDETRFEDTLLEDKEERFRRNALDLLRKW